MRVLELRARLCSNKNNAHINMVYLPYLYNVYINLKVDNTICYSYITSEVSVYRGIIHYVICCNGLCTLTSGLTTR